MTSLKSSRRAPAYCDVAARRLVAYRFRAGPRQVPDVIVVTRRLLVRPETAKLGALGHVLVEAGARRRHFRLGAAAGRGRLVAGRRLLDRHDVVARRRRHHLVAGRVVARLRLVGGGARGRAPGGAARHRVLVPGQDGPAVVTVSREGGRRFFDDVVVVPVARRRGGEGVGGEGRPAEVSARRPAAPRAG